MGIPEGESREAKIITEESKELLDHQAQWMEPALQGKRKYTPRLKTIYLQRSKNLTAISLFCLQEVQINFTFIWTHGSYATLLKISSGFVYFDIYLKKKSIPILPHLPL